MCIMHKWSQWSDLKEYYVREFVNGEDPEKMTMTLDETWHRKGRVYSFVIYQTRVCSRCNKTEFNYMKLV
jgi:hypothetical protein